jgi:mono/diheme cytochrome c family protein
MNKRRGLLVGGLLVSGLALGMGCATKQQRTIEPTSGVAAATAGQGAGAPAGGDTGFVLSRKPVNAAEEGPLLPVHTGELWWAFRASFLGMNDRQVRDRDAAISETEAPDKFWDGQTAVEAASLWSSLCNECHGGRRKIEDALAMPPPPDNWGRGEGLFFGKRRPFADVFNMVYNGGPTRNGKRSEMPPWRGKIAREQIWAVLYFLVYQSGGIEGPFPPSLQPRQNDEIRRVLR